jgi:heme oxygenase
MVYLLQRMADMHIFYGHENGNNKEPGFHWEQFVRLLWNSSLSAEAKQRAYGVSETWSRT